MAWHNGFWWPLYTTAWYSPLVSQYMFDPYSLTHILHGIIFHLILSNIIQSSLAGFLITMTVELVWELVENCEPMIRRFRENSGTSGELQCNGDSVQNTLFFFFIRTKFIRMSSLNFSKILRTNHMLKSPYICICS